MLSSLQERIKDDNPELLDRMFKEFSCKKDCDVVSFLREKAIPYERSGVSRTYIYFSDAADFTIAAYFTVAITSTDFEGVTASRKAKVLGGKQGRSTKDHFGGILIAQLARNDCFSSDDINGKEMLFAAEKIIDNGRFYLGGKVIYIDCREPLITFYKENGYSLLSENPQTNNLFKMYKALPKL